MANEQSEPIRTLSLGFIERLKRMLAWAESVMPVSSRRKRTPQPWNNPANTEGGTGGGGCCCNELDCLRVSGVPDEVEINPEYYEFTPSTLVCGCDPAADAQAKVRLYQVDPDDDTVWESPHGEEDEDVPQCLGTANETVSCIVTATWKWTTDGTCTGLCNWVSNETSPGVFEWTTAGNNCVVECGEGLGSCDSNPPASPPTADGQETTTACIQDPHWVLDSVDDDECECTPEQPDYDGTEPDETAETTCEGTKVVDSSETLLSGFWRLTINETIDYFGCDQTRLEFIIGENVALSYKLTRNCNGKPFCRKCVNSFSVQTCFPRCTAGPSTICLTPKLSVTLCPACETPKLILLENFQVFAPTGFSDVWVGDFLLQAETECSWYCQLPPLTVDTVDDFIVDAQLCSAIALRTVYTGQLRVGVTGNAIDGYEWTFQYAFQGTTTALEDSGQAPPCDVQEGEEVPDSFTTGGCVSSPFFQAAEDFDCETPFDLDCEDLFTAVTINFLDASDL